jgi:hypothetical protein
MAIATNGETSSHRVDLQIRFPLMPLPSATVKSLLHGQSAAIGPIDHSGIRLM